MAALVTIHMSKNLMIFSNLILKYQTPISSDELLPWLIQALIHCQIFNLYSQLDYMSKFNLSQDDTVIFLNNIYLLYIMCKYFSYDIAKYSIEKL